MTDFPIKTQATDAVRVRFPDPAELERLDEFVAHHAALGADIDRSKVIRMALRRYLDENPITGVGNPEIADGD